LQPRRSAKDIDVHSLAELQAEFASAMTTGDAHRFDAELVGGTAPRNRLGIHLRHYEKSLTSALLDKFPACTWLLGGELVRDAARAYARLHPPERPCIAEYGRDFPQFLAGFGRAASLPYFESFAVLEWVFGQVSIAVRRYSAEPGRERERVGGFAFAGEVPE
jgi:hypothetical protein